MALVAGGGGGPKKAPIQYTAGNAARQVVAPPAKATVAPSTVGSASPAAKSTAAAPAAPATGTPAAVTTGTPQANAYPWLDSQFGKYFQTIQQDFADRGLLDSTNKLQPMTELADAYSARWAQEARTDNQQAISNALALWERLTSANLARQANELAAGMDYKYEGVQQPSIFADIFKNVYLPPTKSSGGPIGDAPVVERRPTITRPLGVDTARGQVVPTYTESAPNYAYRDQQAAIQAQLALQRQQEARLAQQAAQESAISNAYLKLAQEQDARASRAAESESDPWALMADAIVANRMAGLDETPGDNMYPTQLFNTFKASYGIDLEELIRNGDERAEALVRSAYGDPAYADRVIARIKGIAVSSPKVPWRDFHTESGAPTGGRVPMPKTTNYYSYPGAFPFPSK